MTVYHIHKNLRGTFKLQFSKSIIFHWLHLHFNWWGSESKLHLIERKNRKISKLIVAKTKILKNSTVCPKIAGVEDDFFRDKCPCRIFFDNIFFREGSTVT